MRARRIGTGTRLGLALQVGLAGALALATCILVIDLADWWYARVDLSASGRNTLDPNLVEVIERLPETAAVDVFVRPFVPPYDRVTREAADRMLDFLSLVSTAHRDRLHVRVFGPGELEQARSRQTELGVEGDNLVVVSCGERTASLSLLEDCASIDWGHPTASGLEYLMREGIQGVVDPRTWTPDDRAFRPARLADFRGPEAFGNALLRVSAGRPPRVAVSTGHGEADLDGATTEDLSRLRRLLERDGFEVVAWDGEESGGRVPEDVDVVVIPGPRQPLGEALVGALRDWVEAGGRVLVAPHAEEVDEPFEWGAVALLSGWGMVPLPGIVCQPVVDFAGRRIQGIAQCADFKVGETRMDHGHPLAELERRHNRKLSFALTPALEARVVPGGRFPTRLVLVPADAWVDRPDPQGRYDFTFDPKRESKNPNLALVCVLELGLRLAGDQTAVRRGRVVGLASPRVLTNGFLDANRHFVRNLVNWLAEREHRLRVTPREPGRRYLDLQRSDALPTLTVLLWGVLPGSCIAVGLFLAWRRRHP